MTIRFQGKMRCCCRGGFAGVPEADDLEPVCPGKFSVHIVYLSLRVKFLSRLPANDRSGTLLRNRVSTENTWTGLTLYLVQDKPCSGILCGNHREYLNMAYLVPLCLGVFPKRNLDMTDLKLLCPGEFLSVSK